MSVGLGKAREIIHFEDIVCETSLLTYSRGADLLLNHLFTVSHLVIISDHNYVTHLNCRIAHYFLSESEIM